MSEEDFEKTLFCEPGTSPMTNSGLDSFDAVCPGCVVGNYRVLKSLSEGGMGKIFLCHPLDDFNVRYVLKVLKSEMNSNATGKKRFRREFELLNELAHENIVQTCESWFDEGSEYIIMEYVSGMNLAQMVQSKYVFTSEYCIYMMAVLAHAFHYAWDSLKLLHRDIKPSNIMIDDENVIKILDFGIAKSLINEDVALTMAGTSLGSPGFMSPEQYLDPRNVDCTSDIFSLGATIYYCLSGGHLPFEGKNIADIILAMRKGVVRPLREYNPDVPPNFEELIMATLNSDPAKRPYCWDNLIASIDSVYQGGKMITKSSGHASSESVLRRLLKLR